MANTKQALKLTPTRLAILCQLAEYRFLTTGQLWQLSSARRVQRTREDLRWLAARRLVASFAYEPERGRSSEQCWLLLIAGARLLEKAGGLKIKYGANYRRRPDREQIEFRGVELALTQQVKLAGWQLLKPQTYSRSKPLPDRTPQFQLLAGVITREEAGFRGFEDRLDLHGHHTLIIPLKLNDYVAYNGKNAVVFILCPPRAGRHFWQARTRQYQLLAKRLKVIAVFASETEALGHKVFLEEARLLVTTVDRIARGLSSMT